MIRSRVTLAMIDAAAMLTERPSPLTSARASQGKPPGTLLPSIKANAGTSGRAATARRMARNVACRMLSRSISATLAIPIPKRTDFSISPNNATRRAALIAFESLTPCGIRPASNSTAAATTGPAHGPRPTSSTPQTGCGAARSNSSVGMVFTGFSFASRLMVSQSIAKGNPP